MKPSANRIWPEPEGRGALLVKKGAYDSVRQLYDEERKRDLVNTLQKRREVTGPGRILDNNLALFNCYSL